MLSERRRVNVLQPEQPGRLDHERTARQLGPAVEHVGTPTFAVDHEELAPRGPLPAEPEIDAERLRRRVVLNQATT